MWNKIITPEQYRQTLRELMRCELWRALKDEPQTADEFNGLINKLTEAYRFSRAYKKGIVAADNAEWIAVLRRLHGVYMSKRRNGFPDMWEILEADFLPRFESDLQQAREIIENSFSGFSFEYHLKYYSVDGSDLLTLHFRNYFAPDSPFNHLDELAEALGKIVAQVESERPDVTGAQCATWINNLPVFQSLFPAEWMDEAIACPLEGHTGCWGQLIDRQGRPHRSNIEYLLKNGELRYANMHCVCPLDNLKSHLAALSRKTQQGVAPAERV